MPGIGFSHPHCRLAELGRGEDRRLARLTPGEPSGVATGLAAGGTRATEESGEAPRPAGEFLHVNWAELTGGLGNFSRRWVVLTDPLGRARFGFLLEGLRNKSLKITSEVLATFVRCHSVSLSLPAAGRRRCAVYRAVGLVDLSLHP